MENKDLEQVENNKIYLIIGALLIVIIAIFFTFRMKNRVEVNVINPEKGDISKNIYSEGLLKSDEEARIHSPVKGEIKVIHHKIGDLVNKGDILYELDKEAIEEELKELNEYLKREELNNEKIKNNISLEEVEMKSKQVDNLDMELERLREKEFDSKSKYEAGEISLEEYQIVIEDKIKKEEEVNAAKRDFQLANRALIQNLNMESMGKLKELTLKKKNLEELLKNHTIKANVSGIVLDQLVEKGDYIKSNDYLMKIGKMENIYLEAIIPNDFAEDVKESMDVLVMGELESGLKEGDKESKEKDELESNISFLARIDGIEIDELKLELKEEGAAKIKAYSIDLIDEIKQGMNYRIGIEIDRSEDAILIPDTVLVNKNQVYLVENNKIVKKDIEVGIDDGNGLLEVISGLDLKDNVIILDSDNIVEGKRVKMVGK